MVFCMLERILRNYKSHKKIKCLFVAFFVLGVLGVTDIYSVRANQEGLNLYASSAVLIDASNNRILYSKNCDEIMPMASTTKIMTAILALEYGNLDDIVAVSKKAASMPKVHLGMKEGEKYSLRDLLYSIMLESHNDSAVAIAEHIGGSVEGFADMMNQKARDLGCANTYFVTPNGLDAEFNGKQHATTAYELAKIAAYAIQNKEFLSLISIKNANIKEMNSGRTITVYNKDLFLNMMDGAIGIKTGFTNKAGYCFVGAVDKDGKKLVSVVLASGWPPHKEYKWSDTKNLMKYGLEEYDYQTIELDSCPKIMRVQNGIRNQIKIEPSEKQMTLLLSNLDQVEINYELKNDVVAPIDKGELLGRAKIMINDILYKEIAIKSDDSLLEYSYKYCLTKTVSGYIGIDVLEYEENIKNEFKILKEKLNILWKK